MCIPNLELASGAKRVRESWQWNRDRRYFFSLLLESEHTKPGVRSMSQYKSKEMMSGTKSLEMGIVLGAVFMNLLSRCRFSKGKPPPDH